MPSLRPDAELLALLDAAVDGIVLIDHLGQIQTMNRSAERLFGYTASELVNQNVCALMTEPDRSAHNAHLARYLKTRVPHIIGRGREVTARRKDGSVFPAYLSVGAIASAEPPRFVGFVQDITMHRQNQDETRRLHTRLWHVSRLATVGEMASGIAHELNQPLAAIANYAQACDRLLTRPDADREEIHLALKEITTQAVRAGDIIRKLRNLARDQVDRRESTDINVLLTELMDLVRSDAKAHAVQLRLELGKELPPLKVHRTQIQQVVLNLVRNALESLSEAETGLREVILRTARGHDADLELSVCDNGLGVAPEIEPRLFEPFCTSKPAGSGLGLAISRTIIGEHRGTVTYRPNTPTGACFVVRLPLHGQDET